MSTLTTSPVSDVLTQLYADAERGNAVLRQLVGHWSPAERAAYMADPNADYRGFYHQAKEVQMAVSPDTGKLLYMLARSLRARSIIEFGTSFGISTLHLAAALRDNGGGHLIGTDLEPEKIAAARSNLSRAGLSDLVELREGDALQTLATDLPDSIDLVLLDGHKGLYPRVLDLLAPQLHAGSCLVADNADMSPEYIARVRAPNGGYLSVPFASDVELSMRL